LQALQSGPRILALKRQMHDSVLSMFAATKSFEQTEHPRR
jgi:hypothetical protein